MGGVAGDVETWTALAPGPGMTCLTAGPEETTLPRRLGAQEVPGAQMMRTAAGEVVEEGEEEAEAGVTNLPATPSMNRDRNRDHEGMNATL